MRGNLTGKSIQAIAAAAVLFASGVWLSATGALASGGGAAQAVGQSSGQNPSQNSGPNSTARQTNRPQQTPGLPTPGQNGARDSMYKPAQAVAAADTQYPFQTSAEGIVVLDVSIGERGEVKKTSALVDVPPFTAAAEQSLKSWKFAPATQNGRAEDSEMLVAFAFRHAVYLANPPALNGVFPTKGSEGGRSDFIAPAILYATYAGYPASTIALRRRCCSGERQSRWLNGRREHPAGPPRRLRAAGDRSCETVAIPIRAARWSRRTK